MTATSRSLLALFVGVGVLAGGRFAPAAEGEKEKAPPSPAPEAKPDPADRSLREQNIYIPYDKLRQVFEKHGRGVFLPYEEFDNLWRAARDKTQPAAEAHPPVGSVITEIENEATVRGDVVQVTAHLKIDLLAEGWQEVPLRLNDAAIVRATLAGQPARVLGGAGESHRLLVEKKGKQPESIELVLEYAKAITRSPGTNSVSFETPQAPVSRWRVRIPQAGVKVNLQPLIAATEMPSADTQHAKPADETVVLAFLGASPTVRIEWTPKAEGATGLSALASVQADQQVIVQEGVVHVHANLTYTISRAELGQFVVDVPADYKVLNVLDPNVRQWSVAPSPMSDRPAQRITIQLFEPAKTSQQVSIELEKIAGKKQVVQVALPKFAYKEVATTVSVPDHKQEDKLMVPMLRAVGVGRQQGFVVVQVGSGLRAEASRNMGLSQVDAGELPPDLASTAWAFAYRYAAVPFELELAVEEVQPRITVDSLVEARLEPNRLTLDLTAIYTIERAGVFKLELERPAGFEVRQVRGREIPGDPAHAAAAVAVDSHHLEGPKGQERLVVNLARKALGRVALSVEFQKDLQEPDLSAPTGKSAAIELGLPQVAAAAVERAAGRLVVYAPASLRVHASKIEGLRTVSLAEAFEGMGWAHGDCPNFRLSEKGTVPFGTAENLRPVLPFAFTRDAAKLRLAAERLPADVTVNQLLVARIEEGRIEYQDTFRYTVLYSGIKSLRIDVPADVAPHCASSGIQDRRLDPQPTDVARGMVAWNYSGTNELLGSSEIQLSWEKKIEKLEVGKGLDLTVPRLVPQGVNRAWGQVVLGRAETLDVHERGEPQGLQPIDPQNDLLAPVPDAARAFRFDVDWKLPITVTRYELEDVKRTSIDRAVVRMVLTPAERVTAVQALYRVRSVRQRLTIELPADAEFDADPLRLGSRSAALQKGSLPRQFYIPLAGISADEPFLLELRYTVPGGGPLSLPVFIDESALPDHNHDESAVQEVHLCVFAPETQVLLGSSGPWTEDFTWGEGPSACQPRNRTPVEELINRVREGVKDPGPSADSFHTDGTLYVFSTLRPPPDGDLRIHTIDYRLLSGLVFAVVLLGGLALVPVRWTYRLLAAGGLIVALVLLGTFLPTFSRQLLGGWFWTALGLVAVVWAVVFVFRASPALALAGQGMAGWLRSQRDADPSEADSDEAEPGESGTPQENPLPLAKPGQSGTPEENPTGASPSEGGPSHE